MELSTSDFTGSRVPLDKRTSLLTVTLVRVGAMTALSQFMLGATLGQSLTFYDAVLTSALGSLILEFVSLGLGIAGQREGISTSLLARWSGFGKAGSALIGLVIGISLLGWFGVQNGVFAKGLDYAFNNQLGFTLASIITGALITVIVAFGFTGLSHTARISVPLFLIIVAWSAFDILSRHSLMTLISTRPTGEPMTLAAGATAVAGGFIAGALITPDLSRFCKSTKDVFWMTFISIVTGELIINTLAILIAHAMNTSDVVAILTQTSGWIGLLTVILATVKINDINLYSSSLGISNSILALTNKTPNRVLVIIAMGVIGTTLSILGILDHFVGFLIFLGILFPPIAGVMLMDYFVVKSSRKVLDESRQLGKLPEDSGKFGSLAVISCIIGSLAGYYITFGIPSLNAIVASAVLYWMLQKVFHRGVPQ